MNQIPSYFVASWNVSFLWVGGYFLNAHLSSSYLPDMNFMVHSVVFEDDSHSAGQEIPFLW